MLLTYPINYNEHKHVRNVSEETFACYYICCPLVKNYDWIYNLKDYVPSRNCVFVTATALQIIVTDKEY